MPDDSRYFDRAFGVGEEAVRAVLAAALSRGGDFADLYLQHATSLSVGFEDDTVSEARTTVDLGAGVRVVVGDQTGYAFSEDLSRDSLLAAARTAAAIASAGPGRGPLGLTRADFPRRYDTSWDWGSATVADVKPVLERIDRRVRELEASTRHVKLGFEASQSLVQVVDSDGLVAFDSQPMARLRLSVVLERNGVTQSNSHSTSARLGGGFLSEERLERLARTVVERTRILFESGRPPAGELPVVLAAGSSGILLHEAIGHGMEADFNRKGISIYSDKVGKPIAGKDVTILDDGTNPDCRGSINFDDEGRGGQATVLVEEGVLRTYMHDRISAAHYGVEPTGSGRRQSFRHPPLPRMRNTYMRNGPHAPEEIVAAVDRGVYCVSFTNGQVNIGAGDYGFYVRNGFLIEGGRLTRPIKDINIIGNGPESLERVTMVGNDFAMDEVGWTCGKDGQMVPVSLGMPTVLVSGIVVGGSAA